MLMGGSFSSDETTTEPKPRKKGARIEYVSKEATEDMIPYCQTIKNTAFLIYKGEIIAKGYPRRGEISALESLVCLYPDLFTRNESKIKKRKRGA